MTWIKICGTTNLEDARAAIAAGADALGFVFAPSPRRISPAEAKEIIAELPPQVERVGVFVNDSAERIRAIADEAGLTAVQLYGDKSFQLANALAKAGPRIRVIAALSLAHLQELATAGGDFMIVANGIDRILLDSIGSTQQGGTGRTWDWTAAQPLIEAFRHNVRIVVAGGLTPANVTAAIAALHPWGVDVCSGVERKPGTKDHDKIRAFVAAVRTVM